MSPTQTRYKALLKAPPVTAAQAARRTAGWAAKAVPILFVVLFALIVFAMLVLPAADSAAQSPIGTRLVGAVTRAALLTLVSGAFLALLHFLSLHRRLAASAFGLVSFCATFFGLAMLVVFFVGLGSGAVSWFRTMPALVEERNAALAAQAAKGKDIEAFVAARAKEADEEMEAELDRAANDEEKNQIRREYAGMKEKLKANDLTTAQEYIDAQKGIRPNLTAPALIWFFLTSGPSGDAQDAGIYPAVVGSLMIGLITILFAVPLGVGAAVYLEEYRSAGWLSKVIQVNINNLAGVPSVVYGILGAYVFVYLIFRPLEDSHPGIAARNLLGGGLTLALLTLPVIIVAAQEAIRAVPVSLRHGALALGATKWQTIWHHVLPSARPGIFTGTILALSRAMGEAAPLVLFGALLFVPDAPSLLSRFTVLPMQIFGWSDRPQVAWQYNAAMASLFLLALLLLLNGVAIYLRQRGQRSMRA